MADTNGSYNSDRLDRIERMMEVVASTQADMQQDIKNLYRSQVVMGESLNQLTQTVDKALKEIAAAQKHADERLDALILTVDEIIRGRKRE